MSEIQASSAKKYQFSSQLINSRNTNELLVPGEQNKKSDLESEIKVLTKQQALLRKNIGRLEDNIIHLYEKFALFNHDDAVAQTQALYEIAMKDPMLKIKIITLFFLIVFIDITPMFAKLIVHTNYDDYLKRLAEIRSK